MVGVNLSREYKSAESFGSVQGGLASVVQLL